MDNVSSIQPKEEVDSLVIETSNVALPTLPQKFWDAKPVLKHIQQAAHSRSCSADGVFYSVLARLAAYKSYNITVETGIGGLNGASLNLLVALIGYPGGGKSTSAEISADLFPLPLVPLMKVQGEMILEKLDCPELPIGTGEGLCEAYMGSVKEPTGDVNKNGTAKVESRRTQVRNNVFFNVDEGDILTKVSARNGATIASNLRSAWSGRQLGQQNASELTTRIINDYSLGLAIGFQVDTAMPILNEYGTGMAQRFIWSSVLDESIPDIDTEVNWPGTLFVDNRIFIFNDKPVKMTLPRDILRLIKKDRIKRAKFAPKKGEEKDTHKYLTCVKIAGLLALLESRFVIDDDDWNLAQIIWNTSCAIRDALVSYEQKETARVIQMKDRAKLDQAVNIAVASSRATSQVIAAVIRIAKNIGNKVHTDSSLNTLSKIESKIAKRDRIHFSEAVDYAESQSWIKVIDNRMVSKGSECVP